MLCGIFLSKPVCFSFETALIVPRRDQFDWDSFLNKRARRRAVDSVLKPLILSKSHIITMARLPTYDIPLGMSHKNNTPYQGLILVLIVGLFCQWFFSYLFGRTVLQSRDMMLSLRNLN